MIFPIGCGLALSISGKSKNGDSFPTSRLQKGLILLDDGEDLGEEGVGFGVPLVKKGLHTIFPGDIRLAILSEGSQQVVSATFSLNLIEKLGRPDQNMMESRLLYMLKDYLAALIRALPAVRGFLTIFSTTVRRLFGWETLYERAEFSVDLEITYKIDQSSGIIDATMVSPDLRPLGVTEVIMMNEQGAHIFDRYNDSSGLSLAANEIGCWDEVLAQDATFSSLSHSVFFSLSQVTGARLARGRELIDSRLAWSGFGYTFPPDFGRFCYQLKIGRLE